MFMDLKMTSFSSLNGLCGGACEKPSVSLEMVELDRQPFCGSPPPNAPLTTFTGPLRELRLFLEIVGGFGHTFAWDAG